MRSPSTPARGCMSRGTRSHLTGPRRRCMSRTRRTSGKGSSLLPSRPVSKWGRKLDGPGEPRAGSERYRIPALGGLRSIGRSEPHGHLRPRNRRRSEGKSRASLPDVGFRRRPGAGRLDRGDCVPCRMGWFSGHRAERPSGLVRGPGERRQRVLRRGPDAHPNVGPDDVYGPRHPLVGRAAAPGPVPLGNRGGRRPGRPRRRGPHRGATYAAHARGGPPAGSSPAHVPFHPGPSRIFVLPSARGGRPPERRRRVPSRGPRAARPRPFEDPPPSSMVLSGRGRDPLARTAVEPAPIVLARRGPPPSWCRGAGTRAPHGSTDVLRRVQREGARAGRRPPDGTEGAQASVLPGGRTESCVNERRRRRATHTSCEVHALSPTSTRSSSRIRYVKPQMSRPLYVNEGTFSSPRIVGTIRRAWVAGRSARGAQNTDAISGPDVASIGPRATATYGTTSTSGLLPGARGAM